MTVQNETARSADASRRLRVTLDNKDENPVVYGPRSTDELFDGVGLEGVALAWLAGFVAGHEPLLPCR